MASIHRETRPSGSVSWVVRWREGARNRSQRCASRRAAQQLLGDIQSCEDRGILWDPQVEALAPERGPVLAGLFDVMAAYIRHLQRSGRAPRTIQAVAAALSQFERRFPEGTTIDALTPGAVEVWIDEMSRTGRGGRPRAPSTRRKYAAEVESAWSWAWDRAEDFPGVTRYRSVIGDMQVPVSEPVRAPTWEEMDRCIAATRDAWVYRAAILMRFTGLRINQALRLDWSDVDLAAGTLRVRGELGKSRAERRGRLLPMSPHLISALSQWGVREGRVTGCDATRRPENLVRDADGRLREAWAAAGVREEVWRKRPAHSFRRGVESGLLRQAIAYVAIEAYLGHIVGRSEGATSGAAYVDEAALPLGDVAAAIPAVAPSNVVPLPRRGRKAGGARE